jgi:hypothetical protein
MPRKLKPTPPPSRRSAPKSAKPKPKSAPSGKGKAHVARGQKKTLEAVPQPVLEKKRKGARKATSESESPEVEFSLPEAEAPEPELGDELDVAVEPEANGFSPGIEELNGLGLEEQLEFDRAELAAELSEDPVRLYLREIGQVKLLDADHEFRLAAVIEARRQVLALSRHYKERHTSGQLEQVIYHFALSKMPGV